MIEGGGITAPDADVALSGCVVKRKPPPSDTCGVRMSCAGFSAVNEAGGKTHVSLLHDWRDKAPDVLDLTIAAGWPCRQLAAARHRLGRKVPAYLLWTSEHDPLMFRRNHGLYLWSHDYDGFTPYCFMHNNGGVWNYFDGTSEDFNIAYPTVNGVIGTLPLEALREGIDDVRYATLLMQRIEHTRQHGAAGALL